MRHHPEDVGIPILPKDFARAFVRFRSIAIIYPGHVSPSLLRCSLAVFPSGQNIGPVPPEQPFAPDRLPARGRHRRVKLPPYYYSTLRLSIFAEWGLVKANTRRGVFRV